MENMLTDSGDGSGCHYGDCYGYCKGCDRCDGCDGSGFGYCSGFGYGHGSCKGDGCGDGCSDGYGSGENDGSGYSCDYVIWSGCGHGDGCGDGYGRATGTFDHQPDGVVERFGHVGYGCGGIGCGYECGYGYGEPDGSKGPIPPQMSIRSLNGYGCSESDGSGCSHFTSIRFW